MIELILITLLSQSRPLLAQVTYEQLLNAARQDDAWLMNGKDYTSARFSKLDQINSGNVTRLSAQWIFQTGISGKHEVTPLVAGGVMYVTTPANHVFAVDARTGRALWHYQRSLPPNQALCCGPVNRGLAILGSRLYLATVDSHVMALDAKTGALLWDTEMADHREGFSATLAPLVVKD
ncbi:MAG: PQQ-binding-like beta-propeller repeat protein [Acidobacteria bacterium]|nr:PQQ-binding-like beta-propeller repeat protein [Acidobacteriota bacterium]MCI0721759.1 PQQ-binding-like beta-propeller repeat protein [Acidobacteriota bacterium]